MNKLGFYVENSTVQYMHDALRQVQPPTMLMHAGDRGLLQEMRAGLSPDTFIVGRWFVDLEKQQAWLTQANPEQRGRELAETILRYDFGYAKERGRNGRLLVDAWMSLNESVRGPASFADGKPDADTVARYAALDRFQVAFLERLRADGLEAVAFNFAAGNFTRPEHYLDYFPLSLQAYTYLGFHEYGWPTLMPRADTASGAGLFAACLDAFRARYGNKHKVIITEAGLARMYKYPHGTGGDVGWLYPGDAISEEQYWDSLVWYNDLLNKYEAVLGCCLFSIGHTGGWQSFRHLGQDNQLKPITVISRIEALRKATSTSGTGTGTGSGSESISTGTGEAAALLARVAAVKKNARTIVTQADAFLTELAAVRQVLEAPLPTLPGPPPAASVQRVLDRLLALEARLDQLAAAGAGTVTIDIPAVRAACARLRSEARALLPACQAAETAEAAAAAVLAQARTTLAALAPRAAEVTALKTRAAAVLTQAEALTVELGAKAIEEAARPAPPALIDKPGAPAGSASYPTRTLDAIKVVIVHHTVTRGDITPERLAEAQVARGKPGITYHFLISETGEIYRTQALEVVTEQTLSAAANAAGVGVALAGNFQANVPPEAQLKAAAALIAWLLSQLGLPADAVVGRCEVDPRIASPGAQWSQGAQFKGALLSAIADLLIDVR